MAGFKEGGSAGLGVVACELSPGGPVRGKADFSPVLGKEDGAAGGKLAGVAGAAGLGELLFGGGKSKVVAGFLSSGADSVGKLDGSSGAANRLGGFTVDVALGSTEAGPGFVPDGTGRGFHAGLAIIA